MFIKDWCKIFCFVAGLLGLILIGLGVFLLATSFTLDFVTVGIIVAGILLLFLGCTKCFKIPCILCILLALITLFLIIAGILAILAGQIVIGLILISLGVLTLLLTVVCLIFKICGTNCHPPEYPPGCD